MKLENLMTELAKMTTREGGGKYGAREEWLASFEELQEMMVGIVPVVGRLVAVAEAAKAVEREHHQLHLRERLKEALDALEAS